MRDKLFHKNALLGDTVLRYSGYSSKLYLVISNIQYTIYNIRYTIYNIQYTIKIYNTQYTIYNIQFTIYPWIWPLEVWFGQNVSFQVVKSILPFISGNIEFFDTGKNIPPLFFYSLHKSWLGLGNWRFGLAEIMASHWLRAFDPINQSILSFFSWNQ